MANRSTPNSKPANGRTSTKSLGKSKRPKPEDCLGKQAVTQPKARPGFQSRNGEEPRLVPLISFSCFPAFLRDFRFSRRVKGAWWPSRSSKSPSTRKSRGRFDSYPFRPLLGGISEESRKAGKALNWSIQLHLTTESPPFLRSCFPQRFLFAKGGDPHVARANP